MRLQHRISALQMPIFTVVGLQIGPNGGGLPCVGAGPVPARCPVRGNLRGELSENERPAGRAGWHKGNG